MIQGTPCIVDHFFKETQKELAYETDRDRESCQGFLQQSSV
jgi:hypothetical protein